LPDCRELFERLPLELLRDRLPLELDPLPERPLLEPPDLLCSAIFDPSCA